MYELGLAIQQFFEGIVTYVWERHGPFFGIFTAFGLVAMLIGLVVLAIHYSTDLAALF